MRGRGPCNGLGLLIDLFLIDILSKEHILSKRRKFSSFCHPYESIQTPYAKVNQYLCFFIPFTSRLWNRYPVSIIPLFHDLVLQEGYIKTPCNLNWIMLFGPQSFSGSNDCCRVTIVIIYLFFPLRRLLCLQKAIMIKLSKYY